MRSRLALAVTALLAAAALAACSGSDSHDAGSDPSGSPSAYGSHSPDVEEGFERPCSVQVELTGSVEVSWDGNGTVSNASEVTTYQSTHGKDQLIAYAGNDSISTNANITVDGATYTTTGDDGLDVAGNGTGATIDADLAGTGGPGPHLTATFDCTKK